MAETDVIRTPDQRVRVFVSSTLTELAAERQAVHDAVTRLRLVPVMFELGARPHPPRPVYRAYLTQSQVFVGIYWQSYGWVGPGVQVSGLEDEYQLSAGLRGAPARRRALATGSQRQRLAARLRATRPVRRCRPGRAARPYRRRGIRGGPGLGRIRRKQPRQTVRPGVTTDGLHCVIDTCWARTVWPSSWPAYALMIQPSDAFYLRPA